MKKKVISAALAAAIIMLSSCSQSGNGTSGAIESAFADAVNAAVSAASSAASEAITSAEAELENMTEALTTTAEETTSHDLLTEDETAESAVTEETTTTTTASADEPAAAPETASEETAASSEIVPAPAVEPDIKVDANGNKYADVVFDKLPISYEEFIALPQANLSTVYDTAAMTVLALSYYPTDPEMSIKMYDFVSGPRTINTAEYSFIRDRFMDYDYVPRSYFAGATPQNDYTPDEPYTVRVGENPYTYENDGYAKMFMMSGGADSARYVMLRRAKDGKWYLWEQFILVGIREPEGDSPWA